MHTHAHSLNDVCSSSVCTYIPLICLERGEGDVLRGRRERGCGEVEDGGKERGGGDDVKDEDGVRLGGTSPVSSLSLFFARSLTYMSLDEYMYTSLKQM